MAEELTISMVYGQALLEAAESLNSVDEVLADAGELSRLLSQQRELSRLISMPTIPGAERKRMVKRIFEGRLRPELVNLLYVMIDKNRAGALAGATAYFERLVREERGVALGTIVSACPLSEEQLSEFERETGRLMGKRIRLSNQVEPRVLGGVRIMVEGKVLDTTVETRLGALSEQLVR